MNPILLAIVIILGGYVLWAVGTLLYVLSKDPFDVFSEEDNVPEKDDAMLPFQNNCAGRNYWI